MFDKLLQFFRHQPPEPPPRIIKEGTAITCPHCKATAAVANRDVFLSTGAILSADHFDGVERNEPMVCKIDKTPYVAHVNGLNRLHTSEGWI